LNRVWHRGVTRINKSDWVSAFHTAHERVFTPKNIQSGFRAAGILPYNPEIVLHRLRPTSPEILLVTPHPAPPQTPSSSTTMATPFSADVLTSSPADYSLFRSTNAQLIALINSGEPLSDNARQYLRCVTSVAEKNFVRTSLLTHQVQDQAAIIAARKVQTSGKRHFIKNKFVLTAPEVIEGIYASETKRNKLKARRQKGNS